MSDSAVSKFCPACPLNCSFIIKYGQLGPFSLKNCVAQDVP